MFFISLCDKKRAFLSTGFLYILIRHIMMHFEKWAWFHASKYFSSESYSNADDAVLVISEHGQENYMHLISCYGFTMIYNVNALCVTVIYTVYIVDTLCIKPRRWRSRSERLHHTWKVGCSNPIRDKPKSNARQQLR